MKQSHLRFWFCARRSGAELYQAPWYSRGVHNLQASLIAMIWVCVSPPFLKRAQCLVFWCERYLLFTFMPLVQTASKRRAFKINLLHFRIACRTSLLSKFNTRHRKRGIVPIDNPRSCLCLLVYSVRQICFSMAISVLTVIKLMTVQVDAHTKGTSHPIYSTSVTDSPRNRKQGENLPRKQHFCLVLQKQQKQ